MKLLQENLKTLTNRLSFKERQLDKERNIKNYKQCDSISAEIMKIRNVTSGDLRRSITAVARIVRK